VGDMADYDVGAHHSYTERQRNFNLPSWGEFMELTSPTAPTRDVRSLRVSDLVPTQRGHHRRLPIILDGEPVNETLRERLARETEELENAASLIMRQLAKRTAQLEHLKRFPADDPCVDGDILQFVKKFPTGEQEYSYVAHRADGLWYLTGGRSPQGLTWDAFVNWMGLGVSEVFRLRRGSPKKVIG
jgi:hypothetical protein